jgi:hypothetical protein
MRKFTVPGLALALALSAVPLAGCSTHHVLNINDAPIGINAQSRDVGQIIESALVQRGWQVESRQPGQILAFIVIREHRAGITITYDRDSYSIAYRNSENLNARGDNIHRNYNRWIANLNTDIQRAMSAA